MATQLEHDRRRQVDAPAAALRFRDYELTRLFERTTNGKGSLLEVDVGPPQGCDLAPAQPGCNQEMPKRSVAVRFRGVEKRPRLFAFEKIDFAIEARSRDGDDRGRMQQLILAEREGECGVTCRRRPGPCASRRRAGAAASPFPRGPFRRSVSERRARAARGDVVRGQAIEPQMPQKRGQVRDCALVRPNARRSELGLTTRELRGEILSGRRRAPRSADRIRFAQFVEFYPRFRSSTLNPRLDALALAVDDAERDPDLVHPVGIGRADTAFATLAPFRRGPIWARYLKHPGRFGRFAIRSNGRKSSVTGESRGYGLSLMAPEVGLEPTTR